MSTKQQLWRSLKLALIPLAVVAATSVAAVDAPLLMNYQGVLRDAGGNPVSGDHDVVFRFFDADTGGDEMLIDEHTLAGGAPVTVSGGLFNVALGSGQVSDGSGPGNFTTLARVFKNRTDTWLQIEVEGEVLTPRVQILASAYAMNSTNAAFATDSGTLDGNSSAAFLRADAGDTATGAITFQSTPTGSDPLSGPVCVNPPSANPSDTLLGIAVNGTEKMTVNGAGFLTAKGGGYFQDPDLGSFAYVGNGGYGTIAYGDTAGGYFRDQDDSGLAIVGEGDYGIHAYGDTAGGKFEDWNGTGVCWPATGNYGIQAKGTAAGAWFWDDDHSGYGYIGYGDVGVHGRGASAGAYFADIGDSAYAYLGYGDYGTQAYGDTAGGYFKDRDGVAYSYVGHNNYGIVSYGQVGGGYFIETDSVAYGLIAYNQSGVVGYGNYQGGYFQSISTGTYNRSGYNFSSTLGNGAKNFIQNHPYEQDKVIVYSAVEGDEVGTYTRGSARLRSGVARIELGETFRWVTNPDIGLTAQLTPRGRSAELYVESLSTTTLVVRGSSESDVAFDYMVFGLRIGFEELGVVREKQEEAYLPEMAGERENFSRDPSLERFTALERFKRMENEVSGIDRDAIDLSRSRELIASITTFDPEIHRSEPPRLEGHGEEGPVNVGPSGSVAGDDSAAVGSGEQTPREANTESGAATRSIAVADRAEDRAVRSGVTAAPERLAVSEAVEPGDVLAIDPERPEFMRRAVEMADPRIVGIVAEGGHTGPIEEAPVTLTGITRCKVDAGYGSIRPGDLLTSSPTAGHAMRANEAIPGTILGKALESLDTGAGEIRVLLMLR